MTDKFEGDNAALIRSAESLLELDAAGALVPHGIGGHARAIIEAFVARMSGADLVRTDMSRDPQVQADA